jgi:energy-coupling factor transport system ATP-binding protein
MIRFRDFAFTYAGGHKPAVTAPLLDIQKGSFTLLTGASGSGKSTVLKAINGLVPHFYGGVYSGSVMVEGKTVRDQSVAALSEAVGMVFQDSASQLVVDTVEEEIGFAAANCGCDAARTSERVAEAMRLMNIVDLAGRRTAGLSGGEKQKIAIASALSGEPRALLLDEPLAELDPEAADGLIDLLIELNRRGLTIVVAEHRLDRLWQAADSLIEVRAGEIRQGEPTKMAADLKDPPVSVRLSQALGFGGKTLTQEDTAGFKGAGQTHSRMKQSRPGGEKPGQMIVTLKDLTAVYNGKEALTDVSLDIEDGKVTAVLGPNGAGKTTLLRSICGLHKPANGAVYAAGLDPAISPPGEVFSRIGYVPQRPGVLLFADTVALEVENTQALEAFSLSKLAESYPRDLSHGEQQRVALAAVLASPKPLLLLDEPTHGLDMGAKKRLADLARRIARQGTAVIIATHDIETAAIAADNAVILEEGRIAAAGEARDILTRPGPYQTQAARVLGPGFLSIEDAVEVGP